jgi:predicted RNA-binding protein YlxR (DUF448 family)
MKVVVGDAFRGKKERGVYITSQNYVALISINCRLLKKNKNKNKTTSFYTPTIGLIWKQIRKFVY